MKVVRIHPIGYEQRPHGHHPDLFKAIEAHLVSCGHSALPASSIKDADTILFDSNVWDVGGGKQSPYDWSVLDVVLSKQMHVVFFDNFDHWGTPTYDCIWPGKNNWEQMSRIPEQDYARFIVAASKTCPLVYFMRKMQDKGQQYPDLVHPLEYPLFDDFPLVSKESLFARPNDVCFLANASWRRIHATIDIYRDGRLKFDGDLLDVRIDHFAWVDRHRNAKMFIEADCSMGSERPQRLMTVAPMLRVRSDHRLPFPRMDMVEQVVVGDYDGHITGSDVDKILSVVRNPDLLYSIYIQGAEHMRQHYSLPAYCTYAASVIHKAFGSY